jgi:FkbM family methyltransferase
VEKNIWFRKRQKVNNNVRGIFLKRVYFLVTYAVAWFFYNWKFKGSTRILSAIFIFIPLRKLELKHPVGFHWNIDSREALWTYLSSCESFTSEVVIEVAQKIETAICIGANRGWYPLLIGQVNSGCDIYAFEPNSKTFDLLLSNIDSNSVSINSHNFAIGKTSSHRDMYAYENANDGMTTLHPSSAIANSFEKIEKVEVKTLDSVFPSTSQVSVPILLQMDIEGAEFEALLGSVEFLKKYSPTVICEINPLLLEAAGSTSLELFQFMDALGYVIYWIDERGSFWSQKSDEPCNHLNSLPQGSGSNYIFLKDPDLTGLLFSKFGN